MSDEKALLAAIWEHPHEDTPRLMYADWLDERGGKSNTARAEFIRLQCEMALLPPSDARYSALEKREAALLKKWRKAWLAPVVKPTWDAGFQRGFPVGSLAEYSLKELSKLTDADLESAPLWRYHTEMTGRELSRYLRLPILHRISTFSLRPPGIPKGWANRVAECDGLRNVNELIFIDCPLTPDDLQVILDAWAGRRLRDLWVNHSPVGDAGMRVIARHPAVAGLRLLRAHTASYTSRAVKAVADSPYLNNLTLATFAHNPIGDAGGRHVLRWEALDGIRELYLMNTKLSAGMQKKLRDRLGTRVRL